jgi:predicted GIY-YIG superfamily endonuclease
MQGYDLQFFIIERVDMTALYFLHSGWYIPRYIGISNAPERRLSQHKRAKGKRSAKAKWVKRHNGRIEMVVVCRFPFRWMAKAAEELLIKIIGRIA